jgi:hypothetical protein
MTEADDAYGDLEILPPDAPGGKFKMVWSRKNPEGPLIDPPKICIACDIELPSSAFIQIVTGQRSAICSHCKRHRGPYRGLDWNYDVQWRDRVMFEDAICAVKLLEKGIEDVKRAAVAFR